MFVSAVMGTLSPPPALLTVSTDGVSYWPSLSRLMSATPRPLDTAKSNDRYPIAPSVWLIAAATPSFPSPPVPTGHCTALSAPTFVDQSELCDASQEVNTNVVPDSSERWTTEIGVLGSETPVFWAAIAGSFQVVISPRKIFATVSPSSCRGFETPWRLY